MNHPSVIRPGDHAVYNAAKMGKTTIFESSRLLVGLNAFEPGQEHKLHAHAGQDKVYHVLEGEGLFLLRTACLTVFAIRGQCACWCWPSSRRHLQDHTADMPLYRLRLA
jgi:oxalate decarboxylase/phosphoglucose isomerase-like protein (cupin superfamily)